MRKNAKRLIIIAVGIIWLFSLAICGPDAAMHETDVKTGTCFAAKKMDVLIKTLSEFLIIFVCIAISSKIGGNHNKIQVRMVNNSPSPSGNCESEIPFLIRERAETSISKDFENIKIINKEIKKNEIPRVLVEYEVDSKLIIKIMKVSHILIVLYFLLMIPMFILCNWYSVLLKEFLSGFYDLDLLIFDVSQQGLLFLYVIHKPILLIYNHEGNYLSGKLFKISKPSRCWAKKLKTVFRKSNNNLTNQSVEEYNFHSLTLKTMKTETV